MFTYVSITTMYYIDQKYLLLVSSQLKQFKKKLLRKDLEQKEFHGMEEMIMEINWLEVYMFID